jgi:hypothetical protein
MVDTLLLVLGFRGIWKGLHKMAKKDCIPRANSTVTVPSPDVIDFEDVLLTQLLGDC